MYRLKLAMTDEEIFQFEKMRTEIFNHGKTIKSLKQATYAREIKNEDFIAIQCLNENELVGGMLLRLEKNNIKISRLFVDETKRSKGAGSYMVDYVMKNKSFFEDYYATNISGVIVEPLDTTIDFYYDKGFDYSGFQMYKMYSNKR